MKRGHAEALMPLIARVMKESGIAFDALDRVAATTGPGSFTGLRVGLSAARGIALGRRQAGRRPDHADRLCRSRRCRERRVSDHLRNRCAARSCVFSGGERQWQSADQAASGADRRSPRCVAFRHAASGRQCRQDFGRSLAGRYSAAAHDRPAAGARYCLGGVARRRSQSRELAGKAVLSTRARRQAAKGPARRAPRSHRRHDRHGFRNGGAAAPLLSSRPASATRRGWRNCMAHRFTAAGAKANSRL